MGYRLLFVAFSGRQCTAVSGPSHPERASFASALVLAISGPVSIRGLFWSARSRSNRFETLAVRTNHCAQAAAVVRVWPFSHYHVWWKPEQQLWLVGFRPPRDRLVTGTAASGNTNSQAGLYAKFIFPRFRNVSLYQEVNGEDNLTYEVPRIGHFLPFAAPSFKGGIDIPRVTADGLTTAHFEYSLLSQRYGFHSDSLYWTYKNRLMGGSDRPQRNFLRVPGRPLVQLLAQGQFRRVHDGSRPGTRSASKQHRKQRRIRGRNLSVAQ